MFLKGEMNITCDEAFRNAISDFFEVVLESDRIASMVKSGSCSMYDIREVFITNIEKRFQTHQLVEGLSKESVVSAWKIKFDQICRGGERPCPVAMTLAVPQAEVTNPSKDQLYELLMRTLTIQKYEHQVLYNACQLQNPCLLACFCVCMRLRHPVEPLRQNALLIFICAGYELITMIRSDDGPN
ncbi:unnamed protein product [Echinostoma caproni]|uniref:Vacuolar protein sorting-associated protein 28 homolog n=1 Tax=Echinostoma caproni TaxID=27848 RepID=A0A183AYD3_9TREM|nr:unnamed protein product [Echinostoma caproni]